MTVPPKFQVGLVVESMRNAEIPDSPRFLTVAELAELLNVKPRTIYEMVAQNRIPYQDGK